MIVRINGQEIAMECPSVAVHVEGLHYDGALKVSKTVDKLAKILVPASAALGWLNVATNAFAAAPGAASTTAGLVSRLSPLINLVQDLALPIGIIVASWGLIEIMLGNPAGKQKIKSAIISYVGVFVIPFLFYEIHHAFRGA